MAGYILLNSLMRDLDKLTISWFMSTEEVAIYTNMSKVLPFDLFSTSMYTVLLPFVTLAITGNHREEAQYIYRQYLNISLITMTIFIVGAMIFSEELVLTLYGDQYLSGLKIFIIYLAVDLIRFANVSLVLSAAGRTKTLLLYSIFSLAANFILNIALYYALGIVGPAAATVIVMLIGNAILMHQSSKVIGKSMFTLFDFKRLLPIVMELIVFGLLFGGLNVFLESRNFYYLLRLVIGYGGFLIVMGLLNLKNILYYLKNINQIKKTTGEESND